MAAAEHPFRVRAARLLPRSGLSLRAKLVAALLATSLISVLLVGGVAYERLTRKFDDLVLGRSARNFRGDVASYWLTYGSWQAGQRVEPFRHFVMRRKALLAGGRPLEVGPRGERIGPDTGDAAQAQAIDPWVPGAEEDAPAHPDGGPGTPPFRFILSDESGRILNPPSEAGRLLAPDEQRRAVPVEVGGRFVAFASPIGSANYSEQDRAYLAAVTDAMAWGILAAALTAAGLGFFIGTRLSRSLTTLTTAVEGMQDGVLRQEVAVTSRDEVGVLARAFNAMSHEIALSHERLQASHRTISEQAEQLREMALRDALTGLYNRRCFDDRAEQLCEQARRYATPLSVAIADIDFFKRINDNFSHAVGDAVLREVAQVLHHHSRAADLVARYGGEEFVFAFPQSDLAEAAECCERLRRAVEAHDWNAVQPGLTVTLSIGLAEEASPTGVQAMLARADEWLYEAKSSGRNRVCAAVRQAVAEPA